VLYERAFSMHSMSGGRVEAAWYGPALQKLGDLYAAKGDRTKAAGYYMKFVELYRDADPEIATQVRNVKAKLAKFGEKDRYPRRRDHASDSHLHPKLPKMMIEVQIPPSLPLARRHIAEERMSP
jgi:hypothetical protein